jgi:hypothetical protein
MLNSIIFDKLWEIIYNSFSTRFTCHYWIYLNANSDERISLWYATFRSSFVRYPEHIECVLQGIKVPKSVIDDEGAFSVDHQTSIKDIVFMLNSFDIDWEYNFNRMLDDIKKGHPFDGNEGCVTLRGYLIFKEEIKALLNKIKEHKK